MTNYELIQQLVEYPPEAEIQFKIGRLSAYSCSLKFYANKGCPQLNPELKIIVEK